MPAPYSADPIRDLRVERPDLFKAPDFWRASLDDIANAASSLSKGRASVIGSSAGGRDIWAFSFGKFEPQSPTATISSALASDRPESYYDPAKRTRPVLALVGGMHGGESEGVAACMDFVKHLETGADLRGRSRPEWAGLDERARLLVVPCINPDGRVKAGVLHLCGAEMEHIFLVQQGVRKDGTLFKGRLVKEIQPVPDGWLLFRGGYCNDAGVNLQHDDFFGPALAPENRALAELFRAEMPDAFLTLHAHGGPAGLTLPDAFIPPAAQRKQSEAAFYILSRLLAAGHDVHPPEKCTGPPWSFYFQTYFHHVCGATPLLLELPHGIRSRPYPMERILDAAGTAIGAWADYASRFGARAKSPEFYGKPPVA